MKTSNAPFDVRLETPRPGSKSAVPLKRPRMYTLPESSDATSMAWSCDDPPKDFAQTSSPDESSFTTNVSSTPVEVRDSVPLPGSKSTVPS